MKKPSEIFDEHKDELENYLFDWGLHRQFQLMQSTREGGSEFDLAMAAHKAWDALPDTRIIRKPEFFVLTDMAEQIFNEELKHEATERT